MSNDAITGVEKLKLWMQFAITLLTVTFAIWIIFGSHSTATEKQMAAGWIGLIFGFWFSV